MNMKGTVFVLLVLGLAFLATPQAWATIVNDDIVIDYVRASESGDLYNSGTARVFSYGGGPFWAAVLEDSRPLTGTPAAQRDAGVLHWVNSANRDGSPYTTLVDKFYTFCVETEAFTPGDAYDVQGLGIEARNTNKVLTGYGAWVYDKFRLNVVAATLNPRNATTDAEKKTLGAYQLALWAGMVGWTDVNSNGNFDTSEPLGAVGLTTSAYYARFGASWTDLSEAARLTQIADAGLSYAAFLLDDAYWAVDGASEWAMLRTWNYYQCINVQGDLGNARQDQMLYYGGPGGVVPEPVSLAIWGVAGGLGAMGLSLRRRRSRWSDENRQAIVDIVEGRARQG